MLLFASSLYIERAQISVCPQFHVIPVLLFIKGWVPITNRVLICLTCTRFGTVAGWNIIAHLREYIIGVYIYTLYHSKLMVKFTSLG